MQIRHFLFVLLIVLNTKVYSQNHAYYVKQTQISMDFKSWKALHDNGFFDKIIITDKGIEFYNPNAKYTLIEWNKINKVDLEQNSYRYDVSFGKMVVNLFFIPMPFENSEPKFVCAVLNMPGLKKENPSIITFFRLIFVDELITNNYVTE